jgi:hypothetical protein
VEVMRLPQKDRTDWLAVLLVLLIFAILMVALLSVGAGSRFPILNH